MTIPARIIRFTTLFLVIRVMSKNENLHEKIEVKIIIESIKEIHLLDKDKSRKRTIVMAVVSGGIILIFGTLIYITVSAANEAKRGADRFNDWLKNNPIIL